MTRPERPARRLSALIVNYNSGAWTLRCVESLRESWLGEGRAARDLEVCVLDSGSDEEEATWWRSLRRAGVQLKCSPANVGYATGLNMAFELSSGGSGDIVALLNPDLYFTPGSIAPLMERLEQAPGVGAVAPRIFLDEERQILLPPNELPTPARELREALATRFASFARRRAEERTHDAQRFWGTGEVQTREMLSGACLFLRRSTLEDLGGAMDGAFPLYFEDADLCRRLRQRGLTLELQPRSHVLHHWSRCAGPEFAGEVAARHAFGRDLYMAKHHGGPFAKLLRRLTAKLEAAAKRRPVPAMHECIDLGTLSESPEIELGQAGECLFELSLTPFWGLCAGTFVTGTSYRYPARSWSWIFPGTYYLRAVQLATGRLVGAWRFTKSSPARAWPLDVAPATPFERARAPWRGGRVG